HEQAMWAAFKPMPERETHQLGVGQVVVVEANGPIPQVAGVDRCVLAAAAARRDEDCRGQSRTAAEVRGQLCLVRLRGRGNAVNTGAGDAVRSELGERGIKDASPRRLAFGCRWPGLFHAFDDIRATPSTLSKLTGRFYP